jgi:hypothetical protein
LAAELVLSGKVPMGLWWHGGSYIEDPVSTYGGIMKKTNLLKQHTIDTPTVR